MGWRGPIPYTAPREAVVFKQECGLREAGHVIQSVLGSSVLRAVARQLERGFPEGSEPDTPALRHLAF